MHAKDSGRMAAIMPTSTGSCRCRGRLYRAARRLSGSEGRRHRLRFVTNNTTRARQRLADTSRARIDLQDDELATTPLRLPACSQAARLALTMEAVRGDLAERVELVDGDADVVLLGGADESEESGRVFAYESLNRAFAELDAGARLVCLHRNRWWQTSRGPMLDAGAFVAGLEYAAGVEAEVVGKPSRAYFEAALAGLGASPDEAVMVGDDVESDVAERRRRPARCAGAHRQVQGRALASATRSPTASWSRRVRPRHLREHES